MLFYRGTKYELAPIRPVSKFLTVKAVVFLTYWQGVAIAILVWTGVLRTGVSWPSLCNEHNNPGNFVEVGRAYITLHAGGDTEQACAVYCTGVAYGPTPQPARCSSAA